MTSFVKIIGFSSFPGYISCSNGFTRPTGRNALICKNCQVLITFEENGLEVENQHLD